MLNEIVLLDGSFVISMTGRTHFPSTAHMCSGERQCACTRHSNVPDLRVAHTPPVGVRRHEHAVQQSAADAHCLSVEGLSVSQPLNLSSCINACGSTPMDIGD